MDYCTEEYCKKCGETFDPMFGCRCSLVAAPSPLKTRQEVRLSFAKCGPVIASAWLASLVAV